MTRRVANRSFPSLSEGLPNRGAAVWRLHHQPGMRQSRQHLADQAAFDTEQVGQLNLFELGTRRQAMIEYRLLDAA